MSDARSWRLGLRTAQFCLCFCLGLTVATRSLLAQATSAAVIGEVVTEDGAALADAIISIAGSDLLTKSDSRGRFHFPSAPWGQVRLRARVVGFVPQDTLLMLASGGSYSVRLRLVRLVSQLDTVRVHAILPYGKPARYSHTGKFDEFYERRAKRPGTYFTREDIESSGRSRVSDLVSSIAGVTIGFRNGEAFARVARCTAPTVPTGASSRGPAAYKWLAVYLDGQRLRNDPVETLSQLSTNEVETIEVYRGVSQLPIEAMGDACAAVFITTRYSAGSVLENRK